MQNDEKAGIAGEAVPAFLYTEKFSRKFYTTSSMTRVKTSFIMKVLGELLI